MRFDIIATLATLAATGAADSMILYSRCSKNFGHEECTPIDGFFYTDFGTYTIKNGKDGCRKIGVPGMTGFCIDWKKNRAHFQFDHQDHKRCLNLKTKDGYPCDFPYCHKTQWEEVQCNWREDPVEPGNTVSAAPTATEAADEATN